MIERKDTPVKACLNTVLVYARDPQRCAGFYQRLFGFECRQSAEAQAADRLIELVAPAGGMRLLIHPAARSVKLGQVGVKLVFDVEDIEAFKSWAEAIGLPFGATHCADGYSFANAKDPDGNPVSISSRAFRAAPPPPSPLPSPAKR